MPKIHLTMEFGCIEEVQAFLARGTIVTPEKVEAALDKAIAAAIPVHHEVKPEAPRGRGRPRKAEAEPAKEVVPAEEKVAVTVPEAPAAPEEPKKAPHAEVRAALIQYAQQNGNERAKALLPAGVAAVKDLSPEQCAEVLARIEAESDAVFK